MNRAGRIAVLAAAIATIAACGGGGTPKAPSAWRPNYQPFSEQSPLRRPLAQGVALHPKSKQMIADLYRHCPEKETGPCKFPRLAGTSEPGRFYAVYGSPVYVGEAMTKLRTIPCTTFPCGIQGVAGEKTDALYDVPIPEGARPEPSLDAHMIVYDVERGFAWELFGARRSQTTGRWKTRGGIRWDLRGTGVDQFGEPGTAVGAGIPMLGTIVRPEEIRLALDDGTGFIPHVLSGGYDSPRTKCFIGPLAKTTDGDDGRTWAIPEGAILQLDPSVDLRMLDLNPAARVIARTLQRYGMVVRDDSGAFTIDVENVSVEDGAEPGRSQLWSRLGLNLNSLSAVQGNMFRVIAWDRSQAHGSNCL
jgi:hypothetical protein